ncbi:hypothetical protein AKJ09_09687 [Labilithrix luteola]|uniref:Uncharacterized protein n=1 Tax=Labilithrix luteola TaxID=1391654 RepID=A0A0K1QBA3_9BACT|nr:DUF5995 family protein [Labilithrix luteola]AKV03024.1 hypothetical protein AKJ09_09687 [Labilithrix luteola]
MGVRRINEVIEALDTIIADSIRDKSRIGYFAVLYKKMTVAVRDSIHRNEFLDCERMERLDVAFANRYLDALEAYRGGRTVTDSWRVAFDMCGDKEPTVLQHLYVGLAAHQLLDLGIAAAEVAPGNLIGDLRGDFDHVNEIVGRLMHDMDATIGRVSPWVGVLDKVAGVQYAVANRFGIYVAREIAWRSAENLARLQSSAREPHITTMDKRTALVGRAIARPMGAIKLLAKFIRARESSDVVKTIRQLQA